MDTLNENFDLASVDPKYRFAFGGTPRRELFRASDRLFRFVSLPQPTFEGNELFKSPWWHSQRTFNGIVRTSNRTGQSIVDTARAGLAVTKDWNPTMEWLAIIELTKPAYGWVGAARHQPVQAGDRSALLIGNLEQVYMPGLAADGNGTSSPYAFLYYYGSMESVTLCLLPGQLPARRQTRARWLRQACVLGK